MHCFPSTSSKHAFVVCCPTLHKNLLSCSSCVYVCLQISGLGIILAAAIFVAFLAALVVHHINGKKYVVSVVQKLRSRSLGCRSLRSVPTSSNEDNFCDNVEKPEIGASDHDEKVILMSYVEHRPDAHYQV
jgi:hypothetical protein